MNDLRTPGKIEFLILPEYIEQKLILAKLSVKDILNYERVKKALSKEDIVALIAYQSIDIFQENIFNTQDWGLFSYWHRTGLLSNDQKSIMQEVAFNLNRSDKEKFVYIAGLKGRLQSENDKLGLASDSTQHAEEGYDVYCLNNEVIVLVVRPSLFERENYVDPQTFFSLVQDVLKELYVHLPRYEVAMTTIFSYYLKQVSKGVVRND